MRLAIQRAVVEPEAAALADRIMDDSGVSADDSALEVDDIAGEGRVGPQPGDEIAVMALRHETNVLAVVFLRDGEPESAGEIADLPLRIAAERKTNEIELLGRGREKEVALVALHIARAVEAARSVGLAAGLDVVAGRQRVGTEIASNLNEIDELDRLVAGDAGHRGRARGIGLGEGENHPLAEAALEIEDVMGDAEAGRDLAGVVNVAAGAAGLAPGKRGPVVVELHRDADDIVAPSRQQRRNHRGINAPGHGDDDKRVRRRPRQTEIQGWEWAHRVRQGWVLGSLRVRIKLPRGVNAGPWC